MKHIKQNKLISMAVFAALSFTMLNAKTNTDESIEEKDVYAQEMRDAGVVEESKKQKKQKVKDAGWYMRIRAIATTDDGTVYKHDTAGVFGKLKHSKYKKDRHDIPAYDAATFQVVFPQYNWGDDSGDYFSDYRKWKEKRTDKRVVYTFQVKNQKTVDLSNASLRLFVDPPQNVNFIKESNGHIKYIETDKEPEKLDDFTLVDVDNQKTYSMDELENTNLSMDGNHTRTFRMVRGNVRKKDFKPVLRPE